MEKDQHPPMRIALLDVVKLDPGGQSDAMLGQTSELG